MLEARAPSQAQNPRGGQSHPHSPACQEGSLPRTLLFREHLHLMY
jgi:hypothetical protein